MTALHQGVDVALDDGLLQAVLATTWVTRSSLFLSDDGSCSENLLHLAPISLRTICLVSADGACPVAAFVFEAGVEG
jgi:hypothetical protein